MRAGSSWGHDNTRGETGGARPMAKRRPSGYCLFLRGVEMPLREGILVLGRGSRCDVVVPDPLVSRIHARLIVRPDAVILEDVGSANGVFVNERRVRKPVPLGDGDRILVGTNELSFFFGGSPEHSPDVIDAEPDGRPTIEVAQPPLPKDEQEPDLEDTLTGPADRRGANAPDYSMTSTRRDPLLVIVRKVDELMARGNTSAAERLLEGFVEDVCAEESGVIAFRTADMVGRYCLKLAAVTGDAGWVNRALLVYERSGHPMSTSVLDDFAELVETIDGVCGQGLARYQRDLERRRRELPAEAQLRVDRILSIRIGDSESP